MNPLLARAFNHPKGSILSSGILRKGPPQGSSKGILRTLDAAPNYTEHQTPRASQKKATQPRSLRFDNIVSQSTMQSVGALERRMSEIENKIESSQASVPAILEDTSESGRDARILLQRLARKLGTEARCPEKAGH